MQKTVEIKLSDDEASQIESGIAKCEAALTKVFQQMKKDQAEIEKLKRETRTIIAGLKAA